MSRGALAREKKGHGGGGSPGALADGAEAWHWPGFHMSITPPEAPRWSSWASRWLRDFGKSFRFNLPFYLPRKTLRETASRSELLSGRLFFLEFRLLPRRPFRGFPPMGSSRARRVGHCRLSSPFKKAERPREQVNAVKIMSVIS